MHGRARDTLELVATPTNNCNWALTHFLKVGSVAYQDEHASLSDFLLASDGQVVPGRVGDSNHQYLAEVECLQAGQRRDPDPQVGFLLHACDHGVELEDILDHCLVLPLEAFGNLEGVIKPGMPRHPRSTGQIATKLFELVAFQLCLCLLAPIVRQRNRSETKNVSTLMDQD